MKGDLSYPSFSLRSTAGRAEQQCTMPTTLGALLCLRGQRSVGTAVKTQNNIPRIKSHAVTKLEASARAAGLLNERQRITHTRAFRRAKKSLRIRSLRAGFGPRSHWLWELPRENERSARAERKPAPLRRIGPPSVNDYQADITRCLLRTTRPFASTLLPEAGSKHKRKNGNAAKSLTWRRNLVAGRGFEPLTLRL
jgi:hypothetical protein